MEATFNAHTTPAAHRHIVGGPPLPDEPFVLPGVAVADRSMFVPVLLLALAFVASTAVVAVMLKAQGESLLRAANAQERTVKESSRTRESIDGLGRGLLRLSDAGNTGAILVVDELRKRGVMIHQQGVIALQRAP